jgi:hypothetical protein
VEDEERTGLLLLLSRRYMDAEQASKAAVCLHQAHSLVVLSTQISDVERADAALQIAALWTAMGNEKNARLGLTQTEVVVQESASLLPARRRDLWLRLAASYEAIGDQAKATDALRAAERPPAGSGEVPTAFLPGFLGELPASEQLDRAQADRQQRALALIEQWITLDGGDVGPETADLAEFLRREDAVRLAQLDQISSQATQLAVQARAVCERAAWLTLKHQVSRRGFGLSIVPEWEDQEPILRTELSKAYEDLFRLFGDQATSLPAAGDVDRARAEILRQEILLGELELYPDYPEDQLLERLGTVQQRVGAGTGSGMDVYWDGEGNERVLTLRATGKS